MHELAALHRGDSAAGVHAVLLDRVIALGEVLNLEQREKCKSGIMLLGLRSSTHERSSYKLGFRETQSVLRDGRLHCLDGVLRDFPDRDSFLDDNFSPEVLADDERRHGVSGLDAVREREEICSGRGRAREA